MGRLGYYLIFAAACAATASAQQYERDGQFSHHEYGVRQVNCNGTTDTPVAQYKRVDSANASIPLTTAQLTCPDLSVTGSAEFTLPATKPFEGASPAASLIVRTRMTAGTRSYNRLLSVTTPIEGNSRCTTFLNPNANGWDVLPGTPRNDEIRIDSTCNGRLPSLLTQKTDPETGDLLSGFTSRVRMVASPGDGTYEVTIVSYYRFKKIVSAPQIVLSPTFAEFTRKNTDAPSEQPITLRNPGTADLAYRAAATTETGGAWLSFQVVGGTNTSPQNASGTLRIGQSTSINLRVDPKGLTPGVHRGAITVSASDPVVPAQTLQVRLTVTGRPGEISLEVTGITLKGTAGAAPATTTLRLANTGETPLNWTAKGSEPWLTATSPNTNLLDGGRSVELTVSADPATLTPQTYQANLTISDPVAGSKTVAVTFEVQGGADSILLLTEDVRPKGRILMFGPAPRFYGVITYDLQSVSNGEVFLTLTGEGGELFDTVSTKVRFGPSGTILGVGPVQIPADQKNLYVQAGLAGPDGKTLKLSERERFAVGPPPEMVVTLECAANSTSETQTTLVWSSASCTANGETGGYALGLKYRNLMQFGIIRPIVEDETGKRLHVGESVTALGFGIETTDTLPIYSGHGLPSTVILYAEFENESGQKSRSNRLEFPVQGVSIDHAKVRPVSTEQLVRPGQITVSVPISYSLPAGSQLRRRAEIHQTGQGNNTIVRTASLDVNGPGKVDDKFDLDVPVDVSHIIVTYYGGHSGEEQKPTSPRDSFIFGNFAPPPSEIAQGLNGLVRIANGTIKNVTSATTRTVNTTKQKVGLSIVEDFAGVDLSGIKRQVGNESNAVSGAAVPTAPEFTGIGATWTFSPAIPANGGFSGDLTLEYDASDLPEGGGDPSQLRVVSYDHTTGAFSFLPTIVDTATGAATAHVDSLAPYYTLAWMGPAAVAPLDALSIGGDRSGSTMIAAVNLGAKDAVMNASAYDASGNALPLVDATSMPVTLAPGRQAVLGAANLFGPAASGWMRSRIAGGSALGAELIADSRGFEALPLIRSGSAALVLSPIARAEDVDPVLHVANLTAVAQMATVVLRGADGADVSKTIVRIPASGKLVRAVSQLFPQATVPFQGYLVIVADSALAASALVSTNGALAVVTGRPLRAGSRTPAALSTPVLDLSARASAVVTVTNPTTLPARLAIKPYKSDGTALAPPHETTVAPGAQFRADWTELFGQALANSAGWLSTETDITGILADLASSARGPLSPWSTSIAMVEAVAASGVIPYAVSLPEMKSRLALVNPNRARADVDLQLVGTDGAIVGKGRITLAPMGSALQPLDALIPEAAGLTAGYLLLSSPLPLAAVEWLVPTTGDSATVAMQPAPGAIKPSYPVIGVGASELDFGSVQSGQTKDLPLDLSNTGTASLTISAATLSDPQFRLTAPTLPVTIVPSAKQTLTVRFAPTSTGARTATLTLSTNDPLSPSVAVSLNGTATAAPTACTFTISPTSTSVGAAASTGTVAITASASTCAWTATSSASFVFLTGATSGTGNGSIAYAVAANTATAARSGALTVAGQTFTVNQAAATSTTETVDVVLQVDGGAFRGATGIPTSGGRTYFINRLTPSKYPATLKSVQIYFGARTDGLRAGAPLTLLVGASGQNAQLYNTAVGQTGGFNLYNVNLLTINSGDFLVGFAVDNANGIYPVDVDIDSGSKRSSYVSTDGVTLLLVDSLGADLAGNFGIRAGVAVPK